MSKRTVFIFRRDLRCEDNIALIRSLEVCDELLPIFIFDTVQIEKNDYFAANAFKFLLIIYIYLKATLLIKKVDLSFCFDKALIPCALCRPTLLRSSKR